MRRTEREVTDKNIIEEILTKSIICRIGLNDEDFPYIVPLNYGYSEDALYFHSAKEGRKIDLIRKNSKAGFEIVQASKIITHKQSCGWTSHYRSVIGTGKIDIITDFEQKQKGLDIIMNQHGKADNKYVKRNVDNMVILKLSIISLTAKQAGEWSS